MERAVFDNSIECYAWRVTTTETANVCLQHPECDRERESASALSTVSVIGKTHHKLRLSLFEIVRSFAVNNIYYIFALHTQCHVEDTVSDIGLVLVLVTSQYGMQTCECVCDCRFVYSVQTHTTHTCQTLPTVNTRTLARCVYTLFQTCTFFHFPSFPILRPFFPPSIRFRLSLFVFHQ